MSTVNGGKVLEVRGLVKQLGAGEQRVDALRGVDLDLERGSLVAITGPSGCGKSTLLYLLGLLDRPDAGSIRLLGEEVSGADDAARTAMRARSIGFVFQFHFLLQEFSAWENVALPMRRLGVPLEEARARAHELLRSVGLEAKAGRLARHLSGGEQQRVAIARSLANRPALLLADEPTGNLDATNSAVVLELLRERAATRGEAVVLVTHNHEIAQRCDRVLAMRDGRWARD